MSTQSVVQLLSIAATVVLARLLTPSDFGVVALGVSIAGLLSLVASVGVGANLVRRKSGVEEAASTYYWALAVASIALVGALIVLAPFAVNLAGQPESALAVQAMAVCLPPALLTTVVQSILRWRLNWGRYNITVWAPALTLVVVEVALALAGWGYWAVVVGLSVSAWVGLISAHLAAGWWPAARFNVGHIRSDLGMTGSLWSQQFLTFVQRNSDYWAVSAFLGAETLGVYYVAFVLPSVIRQRVTSVSRATLLAVLSRCADDDEMFRRIWSRTSLMQLFVGSPALLGLAAVGAPVIELFFGSRWSEGAQVVPWICLAALVELYVVGPAMAAVVKGLAKLSLVVAALRTTLTVAAVFVAAALTRDMAVVAIAVAIGHLAGAVVQDLLISRRLRLGWRLLRGDLARILAISLAMYASVRVVVALLDPWGPAVVLIGAVMVGASVYVLLSYLFARQITHWAWRQARLTLRSSHDLNV